MTNKGAPALSERHNLVLVSSSNNNTPPGAVAPGSPKKILRRLAVQVVHRHGDRSPITSLKDEEYWADQLIPDSRLKEIARNVTIQSDGVVNTHKANGRGPFGKLTRLGLQQMEDLGTLLRRELYGPNQPVVDSQGNTIFPHIWKPGETDLKPSNLRVVSTSFIRAIQSAQGVIAGLFPQGVDNDDPIEIDARFTNMLLPDPMPRETLEQAHLEDALAARPHLEEKERELLPLAVRVTKALHPLLAADAHEASFGAKQLRHQSIHSIEIEPLAWNQLGEITKCLACRGMLPPEITEKDHCDVVQHAAWRWFESFRHPRLAWLSMHEQCEKMVELFFNRQNEPPMTLYSAHDSTLIGLLCAFKLEQPIAWPEYGSFLMLELLEVTDTSGTDDDERNRDLYIRFSLNGELLRSLMDEEPLDMILLDRLAERLRNEGKATEGMTS